MKAAFPAVALLSFFLAATSQAQEAPPVGGAGAVPAAAAAGKGGRASSAENEVPWAVYCGQGQEGPCVMRQYLQRAEDRRQVLMAGLLPAAGGETATLRLVLPFGIDPTAPVAIGVDGDTLANPPLRTCLPSGCEVVLPLDAEALAMLRSGSSMGVGLQLAGGQSLELSVDLRGFSAVFDRAASGAAGGAGR